MKRILMIFLIIFVCVTPKSFANSEVAKFDQNEILATKLLTAMDIVKLNEKNINNQVTRGEIAEVLVKMLNIPIVNIDENVFKDLKPKHKKASYMYAAFIAGYMSGYGDGTIGIDKAVSFDETIKVMVMALGYEKYSQARGGYPSGYYEVAVEKKIMSTVLRPDDNIITMKALNKLVFNTMTAEVLNQVSFGATAKYQTMKDWNILNKYHDIYREREIITANRYTSLYSSQTNVDHNEIEINGKIFNCEIDEVHELLGQYVTMYYKKTLDGSQGTLLCAVPIKNNVITIKSEDIIGKNSDVFSYEDDDGDKINLKLKNGIIYIYNNRSWQDFNDSDFKPSEGEMSFIDNNNDGVYEIVNALISKTLPVRYAAGVVPYLTLYDGTVVDLERKQNKAIILYRMGRMDSDYNLIDAREIMPKDTFCVFVSKDGMYIKGYATENIISGTITELDFENKIISINSKKYTYLDSGWVENIKIGSFVDLFLDQYNRAAYYSENNSQLYGYFIYIANENVLNKQIKVKLLSENGKISILKLNDKIYLDGSLVQSSWENIKNSALFSNGLIKPQIVKYFINANGEVNQIDTMVMSARNPYDRLKPSMAKSDLTYFGYTYYAGFAWNIRVDNATIIFMVPKDVDSFKEEDYSVQKNSFLAHNQIYTVQGFDLDDSNCAKALVCYYTPADNPNKKMISFNSTIGIYKDTYKAMTKDNSVANGVTVFEGSDYKKYIFNPSADEFSTEISKCKQGDVVIYQTNSEGYINDFKRLYSIDEKQVKYVIPGTGNGVSINTIISGRAYSVKGGYLVISGSPQGTLIDAGPFYIVPLSRGYLYAVNSTTKKISTATENDIICGKYGDNPSNVLVKTYAGDVHVMTIIN